jgi:hypothetical protein
MAKDGPGQCLSDANDAKHLNPPAFTGNVSLNLYSGSPRAGGYKRVKESRLFLSQLWDFKEARAPVKKQEEQE